MNIGRYEVVEQLGKGGMAIVYLAHDPYIKRQVAVKVLPRKFTHDPQFRIRFQREAEVIATLEHAYIVPVYDFGDHEGEPFIVMRYLPGGTLADRLSTGPLPIPEITPLFQSISSALDYAHKMGVIHRDIKPGNILFDSEGKASLSDFGIAKIQEATAAFTGTGNLVGTPAYMSPEQAMGEKTIDGRSDIYSLGVVLFQALSGELPFKADTPMGVAVAHIQEPVPSLLERRPDLPLGFEDIVHKALDKDPAKRFQTAAHLTETINNLETHLEEEKGTVLEPPLGTMIEEQSATLISRSTPLRESVPIQKKVRVVLPPPPQYTPTSKQSMFPRLVGVGGALLALFLCIGVIGGVASGLIPNPLASVAVNGIAEVTLTETLTSVIPSATQFAGETVTTGPEDSTEVPTMTEAPTTTASAPSSEITDSKGVVMVLVPAGEFPMGGGDLNAEPDEKPVHTVNLDDYYIDKFEVTNAAYIACVEDAGACKPPIHKDSFTRSKYYGVAEYDEYPVVYVNWNMAKTFCEWRGARLPTEAEWEKAARGTDGRIYPWGTGVDCQKANYAGPNGCFGGTSKVGSFDAGKSPYGVYDMAGNVWEWVADWYSESYYQVSPAANPLGPDSGQSRVLRGGSWNRSEYDIRASNRNRYGSTYNNFDIGFRCASDVSP